MRERKRNICDSAIGGARESCASFDAADVAAPHMVRRETHQTVACGHFTLAGIPVRLLARVL